jgi:flagellar hook protein FlgE
MFAGVSAIRAQQAKMNVIGNNLANVNTTAFKGSRVTFKDQFAQTLQGASAPSGALGGRNAVQIGLGVLVAGADQNMEQGSLNATNRVTDLAMVGDGYYMVTDGSATYYTRDGGFDMDANGDIVHRATGMKLTGWSADPTTGAISPSGATGPLNIPLGAEMTAKGTTTSEWAGNLDSRSAVGTDSKTKVRMYDNLGGAHDLDVTFTKTSSTTWDWSVADPSGGSVVTGSGTLTFDPSTGAMSAGQTGSITMTPTGGAPMTIATDFGAIKGLAASSTAKMASQDGFAAGTLSSFGVDQNGIVVGLYSNGVTKNLGQVALASFSNPAGLEKMGGNLATVSPNSGVPTVGTANTDGRGMINSGYLEQSNVDISTEFTDLIVTQRSFQANTKIVTTVDEMLQDLLQMKR